MLALLTPQSLPTYNSLHLHAVLKLAFPNVLPTKVTFLFNRGFLETIIRVILAVDTDSEEDTLYSPFSTTLVTP